jgi:hypothetical protein
VFIIKASFYLIKKSNFFSFPTEIKRNNFPLKMVMSSSTVSAVPTLDNNNNNNNKQTDAVDQSFETVEDDDMESLLPQMTGTAITKSNYDNNNNNNNNHANRRNGDDDDNDDEDDDGVAPCSTPLEIHMNSTLKNESGNEEGSSTTNDVRESYFGGWTRPYNVGNMSILFPEYFYSSDGWGVLGPHWFGPVCVWLILAGASHLCIRSIYKHQLGTVSVLICYLFMAVATFRLTDVSLRDPGIVLDKQIPGHVDPSQVNQYRFCDRCAVWQPPDGIHCPECNVCVAGYDHHCVWMGTCIGKKNYRQFVLFNMTWLYYLGYLFFWILTFGPLIMGSTKA